MPENRLPCKYLSNQDYPHHVALSAIYELPIGRGRPFLTSLKAVPQAIVFNRVTAQQLATLSPTFARVSAAAYNSSDASLVKYRRFQAMPRLQF